MYSPYAKLFGQSPSLANLKAFGTAVYPYLRPCNVHKLQAMSDMCVFLGYSVGYKGVLCYNRTTKRLLLFRHVVHDESVFPFQSSGSLTLHQSPVLSSSHRIPSKIVPIILPRNVNGFEE